MDKLERPRVSFIFPARHQLSNCVSLLVHGFPKPDLCVCVCVSLTNSIFTFERVSICNLVSLLPFTGPLKNVCHKLGALKKGGVGRFFSVVWIKGMACVCAYASRLASRLSRVTRRVPVQTHSLTCASPLSFACVYE